MVRRAIIHEHSTGAISVRRTGIEPLCEFRSVAIIFAGSVDGRQLVPEYPKKIPVRGSRDVISVRAQCNIELVFYYLFAAGRERDAMGRIHLLWNDRRLFGRVSYASERHAFQAPIIRKHAAVWVAIYTEHIRSRLDAWCGSFVAADMVAFGGCAWNLWSGV